MVCVGQGGWSECVSFEFVVKSPMGGVFSWQMTREQCQSQCQPHVCTSPEHSPARPRTLEHKLEYLLFIATFLLRASQNLKSKNHRSKSTVYSWRSLCLTIAWISFNLSSIFGTWKVWWWQMNTMYSKCKWMLPPTNFFLFDISPHPMWWTPRWRSLRSSILPVRQTGGDGCGTWPRSGGEWWSVAWLPGPWPPEMRESKEY